MQILNIIRKVTTGSSNHKISPESGLIILRFMKLIILIIIEADYLITIKSKILFRSSFFFWFHEQYIQTSPLSLGIQEPKE